jgi:hypothetical protein
LENNKINYVTNLWVSKEFVEYIELATNTVSDKLDYYDIEANRIQHYYESIEDQSQPQELKQLSTSKVE